MFSFLNAATTDFTLLEEGYKIGLDWLGQFARVIIEGIGIIGLGIIVFALILKAITLPFDIYQRVKMRKQTLIMRQMQPELEKLQKQYANDKNMYSQKMMELYKKNGYSMLGACLPIIISMVILIVAFQGFRTYSNYANLKMYVDMSGAYNGALAEYIVDGKDYLKEVAENQTDCYEIDLSEWTNENGVYTRTEENVVYTITTDSENKQTMRVESTLTEKCLFYTYSLENTDSKGNYLVKKGYKIDIEKLCAIPDAKTAIDQIIADSKEAENEKSLEVACREYMVKIGATGAKAWYTDKDARNDARFLWVKNVWYPDVSYSHPIQSYKKFAEQFNNSKVTLQNGEKVSLSAVFDEQKYNNLISELTAETKAPNGYFILIILSIGLMVLSQFISMRSQKESNKYQTVDGSGARTQKIMLVMMPMIYAIFAFMYSAAFSIYMVMSSFVSILVTLLSNLIIGHVFKKKEQAEIKQKYTRTLPWMKQENQNEKKGKNNRKK